MIGIWGFLEQLSFVLIPVLLLVVVAGFTWKLPKKVGKSSFKGTIALLVLILLPVFTTWKFVKEVQGYLFFSSLSSERVISLSIGTIEVTDQNTRKLVVNALQGIQWFSSHHGRWGQPVDCHIKLASGKERHFRAALYLQEPGAIIELGSADGRVGIHSGYAFSKALPGILQQMGINLNP